jgi:ankyrin repeat protein
LTRIVIVIAAVAPLSQLPRLPGACLPETAAVRDDTRTGSAVADAAERAQWERLDILLADGADPRLPQPDGSTALHWAAYHDASDQAQLLLDHSVDPRAVNHYGVPPLALACRNASSSMVTLLLRYGADPHRRLAGGETMLMLASRTGNRDAVDVLLRAGAAVDEAERIGQTALMWAAAEGHAPVLRMLLDAGADPNRRSNTAFTALLFAARNGRLAATRQLLNAGVDPQQSVESPRTGVSSRAPAIGTSGLLLAVENGHFELALNLVDAGADPNDERSGFTPLHVLSWVRKPNRGDDDSGQPPPDGSGKVSSLEFARELIRRGADPRRGLKKSSPGPGKLNLAGASPLLLAARTDDLPYMRLLVELGADIHQANLDGCTPLMAAAGIGTLAPTEEAGTEDEALESVDFLLKAGAAIDTVDKNGETAMHGAAYKSLPRMVAFLAEHGAAVEVWNRANRHGWTPLRIAQGYRPGNFKPSIETIDALLAVLRQAGVEPGQ